MTSKASPLKKILSKFNLGNTYEIQARVLPAMLIMLPVAILVAQVELHHGSWLAAIGWGVGLETVIAILISKIGHALGAALQTRLEKEWDGLPTHSWLRPSDTSHSEQQKTLWRKAVSLLSGLNIDKVLKTNDLEETDRVIADAVAACRNFIRTNKKSALLNTHNIAFGFARNLAGMKWIALLTCLLCFGGSAYGTFYHGFSLGGTLLQGLFLLIASVYFWVAYSYVKHCSIRYAEFFYAAVTSIAGDKK